MWRESEETAIEIGLDLFTFWKLTPNQFKKYVNVYEKQYKQKFLLEDTLNYMLGKYICFAFNDVKHYPKKPFTDVKERPVLKEMTASQMEMMAMQNSLRLGGKIKK